MPRTSHLHRVRLLTVATLAGALAMTGCSGSGDTGAGTPSGGDPSALLTIPREDMGSFSRNFNPFSPTVAPMTQQAIYESMLIYNPVTGKTVPWLATRWTPATDGRSLTFDLRAGVKWSDGKPLVAADVVTTFTLQKKIAGGFEYVQKVVAVDKDTVAFTFSKPYSPALYEIGQQVIVPEHVWSKIADAAKETNPNPVGTGPYTAISRFATQSFDLGKNPHYWQPDKQKIAGIRMLAFAGNDGANLAAANGEVDWAPQFIPNIQKVFVAKDPDHRRYWFPATGAMIQWTLNTTKAPFDDVRVRKALSKAVDRKQVTEIGMFGYTHAADCTGLSDAFSTWRDEKLARACDWTTLDVDGANAALDAAGYPRSADGTRTLEDGKPFAFSISVGATSSDWLSVAKIISQNMQKVGVKVTVHSPDWAQVVQGLESGNYDSAIAWSGHGPTPFAYYRSAMSTGTVKAKGSKATENYHRFGDKRADLLLDRFAASFDEAAQRSTANELQDLYDELAPAVPLFPGPEWGAFNDARFTGWPTEQNPYATLGTRAPTTVLVLTSLQPR